MAVLFAAGFEAGAKDYYRRAGWGLSTVHTIGTTPGFVHKMAGLGGTYALQFSGGGSAYTPIIPGTTARWAHFWVRTIDFAPPITGSLIFGLTGPDATPQCTAVFKSDGLIEIRRGGASNTLLNTSLASVNYSTGHWIAINLLGADVGGVFEVFVDGVLFVAFAGDTQSGSNGAGWNAIQFAGAEPYVIDDVIVTDATTGQLPELTGVQFVPNANSSSGWTPSAGTNWQNVSVVPVLDTPPSHNIATVTATEDVYGLTQPIGATSVAFVSAQVQAKRTGNLLLQTGIRHGATTSYNTAAGVGTGPSADALTVLGAHILTANPDTAAPWVEADLAGIQAAAKTA